MRVLIGIILGAVLTVGGAYLYDSHTVPGAATSSASAAPPNGELGCGQYEVEPSHRAGAGRMESDRKLARQS